MATLGSPARTLRGLLRELRYLNAAAGRPYRDTAAYRYLVKAFRAHRVWKPRPGMEEEAGVGGDQGRGVFKTPVSEADPPTSQAPTTLSRNPRGAAPLQGAGPLLSVSLAVAGPCG
jgi:hypothetical protein